MKEITTAQGLLRCGECENVFNAMDTLRSTITEDMETTASKSKKDILVNSDAKKQQGRKTKYDGQSTTPSQDNARRYLMYAVLGFIALLLFQVFYSYRNWFAYQPLTAGLTQSFCHVMGCEITPKRDASLIEVVSRNVYAHPNEPDSLIISASMTNKAPFEQPLPLIEVSFLNKAGDVVALKRFKPEVYQPDRDVSRLFGINENLTFRIKIADPGGEAVRFQFRFL